MVSLRCGSGRAAVLPDRELDGVGDGIVGALGTDLKSGGAAVERDEAIRGAVEDNHRDAIRRPAVDVLRAFDRGDRCDLVGKLAGEAVRHHGAVGDAGGEDPLGVYGVIIRGRHARGHSVTM